MSGGGTVCAKWSILLVLLCALDRCLGGPLPPKPVFLVYKSFKAHPMACTASNPLWASYEWWWDNTTRPLGQVIQQGCWPYQQVLPQRGSWKIDSLMHLSPVALTDLQLRLRRPDTRNIPGIKSLPQCIDPSLMDRDQSYGPVGCKYNIFRLAQTNANCTRTGGTVTANYVRSATPRLDCLWKEAVAYDMTQVPASGNLQMEALANYQVFLPDQKDPKPTSTKTRSIQLISSVPFAMQEAPGKPCSAPYCGWDDPNQHTIHVRAWTDDTQFTSITMTPNFLIPVGGIWRMQLSASRIVEPPPVNSRLPGFPVVRHIISIDADYKKGTRGVVLRNSTGFLYNQLLTFNLKQIMTASRLTPGWHRLTVLGNTYDPVRKGTQSGALSTYFEIVPPCPTTDAVPFMTYVKTDVQGSVTKTGTVTVNRDQDAYNLPNTTPSKANYVILTFDLSFLSTSVKFTSASLFLWLRQPYTSTLELSAMPLALYDASISHPGKPGVPCIAPVCANGVKVGTGQFKGSDKAKYIEVSVSAGFLTRHAGKEARLALIVPERRFPAKVDGAIFRGSQSMTPPFLVMKGKC